MKINNLMKNINNTSFVEIVDTSYRQLFFGKVNEFNIDVRRFLMNCNVLSINHFIVDDTPMIQVVVNRAEKIK